jgi:hypothetical protein
MGMAEGAPAWGRGAPLYSRTGDHFILAALWNNISKVKRQICMPFYFVQTGNRTANHFFEANKSHLPLEAQFTE